MAINIIQGYNPSMVEPIDSRITVANSASRLGFDSFNVYEGLVVYQRDTNELYVLTNTGSWNVAGGWQLVGGGGGSPGGSSTTIQYNNAGAFGGIPELLYKSAEKRVDYVSSRDFVSVSSPVIANANGIGFVNNQNNTRKSTIQLTQIAYDYTPNASPAMMCRFEVQTANLATLTIGGFKCDYALHYYSSEFRGSRVGTLLGSWDYNQSRDTNLNDSSISGDSTMGELDLVTFSLSWVSATPGQIGLYIDSSAMSAVGGEIIFCGLFTIFSTSS